MKNLLQIKRNTFAVLRSQVEPLVPAALLTFSYVFIDFHYKAAVTFSTFRPIRAMLVLWFLLIPVYYIIDKIINNKDWSSLYLYAFVLAFYVSEENFQLVTTLVIILTIGWAAIFYVLRKKKITLQHVIIIATISPMLLFLIVFVKVVHVYFQPDWIAYYQSINRPNAIIKTPHALPDTPPDIYYIVLDGYARADILQEYYEYDNSEFVTTLTDMGFIVPSRAQSNYAKTVASVSSTLNMNYLPEFIEGAENSLFWWQAKPYIQNSAVNTLLDDMGYTSIAIATDWDTTNNTKADLFIKPLPLHLSEYEGNLLGKSRLKFLSPLISRVAYYPTNTSHREMINFNFRTLAELAKYPGPKFVFAHIVSPHPPFVFDKDGNSISPDNSFTFNDADNFPGTSEEYRRKYTGQLEHTNRLLEKTILAILSQSDTPPIIILQADHGPGMMTDFTTSENTCLKERFSVFAAYYLPGVDPRKVPNTMTPVNIFRVVFNEYFSTDLPLLDNASYYFANTVYVFQSEDVTLQLNDLANKNACEYK